MLSPVPAMNYRQDFICGPPRKESHRLNADFSDRETDPAQDEKADSAAGHSCFAACPAEGP